MRIVKTVQQFLISTSVAALNQTQTENKGFLAQENCLSYINFVETTGLISAMTPDFDPDENTCKKWLGTKLFDRNIFNE